MDLLRHLSYQPSSLTLPHTVMGTFVGGSLAKHGSTSHMSFTGVASFSASALPDPSGSRRIRSMAWTGWSDSSRRAEEWFSFDGSASSSRHRHPADILVLGAGAKGLNDSVVDSSASSGVRFQSRGVHPGPSNSTLLKIISTHLEPPATFEPVTEN